MTLYCENPAFYPLGISIRTEERYIDILGHRVERSDIFGFKLRYHIRRREATGNKLVCKHSKLLLNYSLLIHDGIRGMVTFT